MSQSAEQLKATLGYVAGALFCLAGLIEIIAAHIGPHPHTALTAIGAMFLALACLWFMIATRSKKKHQN